MPIGACTTISSCACLCQGDECILSADAAQAPGRHWKIVDGYDIRADSNVVVMHLRNVSQTSMIFACSS